MSLILEALKKSEAERRGALTAAEVSPRPRRRRAAGWIVGITATAALGAALGWWGSRQWQRTVPGPEPVAALPSGDEAHAAAAPAPAGDEVVAGAAPVDPAAVAEAPAPVLSLPPPARAEAAAGGQAESAPRRDREIASSAPPPPRTVTLPEVPAGRPGPDASPAPDDPAPPPAPPAELPRLDQLPAVRAETGALALNMLVYSTDAEARFALINLRRFEEGDEVQPGLLVREIRRDGVVLSHRGRALLLPSAH